MTWVVIFLKIGVYALHPIPVKLLRESTKNTMAKKNHLSSPNNNIPLPLYLTFLVKIFFERIACFFGIFGIIVST